MLGSIFGALFLWAIFGNNWPAARAFGSNSWDEAVFTGGDVGYNAAYVQCIVHDRYTDGRWRASGRIPNCHVRDDSSSVPSAYRWVLDKPIQVRFSSLFGRDTVSNGLYWLCLVV